MKSRREECESRLAGMRSMRKPYEQDWDEIARLCLPARSSSIQTALTQGGLSTTSTKANRRRANTGMFSSKGRKAQRTLMAGMTSGMSSPSRPWFKLETTDKDLLEYGPVKEWLDTVQGLIYNLFGRSNFYNSVKVGYGELGCFGTEAAVMVDHPAYQCVTHSLTAGEYWIANDDGLMASSLYRFAPMSVAQMVDSFVRTKGWSAVSKAVKNAYDAGNYDVIVPCYQAIEKNNLRDPTRMDSKNMEFRSIWWEEGNGDKNVLLRESGFQSKPFWAARWIETGGAYTYGDGPGYDALPDMRELQLSAKRRGRALDNLVRPALGAPTGMANSYLSLDPGTIAYGSISDLQAVRPLMQPDYRVVQVAREEVTDHAQAVAEAFYADLFFAITEMDGVQPRNMEELSMRNEEKLTQLGPVVERVNVEKLEVAVDRAFGILMASGQIPPAPPELQGQPLKIEFISLLAQAQRASRLTDIQRTSQFVGFLAGVFPEAADKFDADQAIDEFATGAGTPPKIIRTDEVVQAMRQQRAAQAAQAQQAAMSPAMLDGAKSAELLSKTNVGQKSVLDRLVGANAA